MAIVASHQLTTLEQFRIILRVLEIYQPTEILFRRPRLGEIGFLEAVTVGIVKDAVPVRWFIPEEGGRDQTYYRDYALVEEADQVLALFHPDHVMTGGTGHVVEAALLRQTPVQAFVVQQDGRYEMVGDATRV